MAMIALLLALVVFLPHSAQAETEQQNLKLYGNCAVFTLVDVFTDERTPGVSCSKVALSTSALIFIQSIEGTLSVILKAAPQFHLDSTIPVLIRVDKGQLIQRQARWGMETDSAYIFDPDLATRLLHDLARGQKVHIKVGSESATIPLTGSRRAIDDFRQRAGLDHQRSLTIPQKSDF